MAKHSLLLVKPAQMVGSRVRKDYKGYFPSITLPTLAAYAPPEFEVDIIDEALEDIDFSKHYSLVAITGLQNNIDRAIWLARYFKELYGDKIIISGGGITFSTIINGNYFLTEEYKKNILEYFDHIFIGEADQTWQDFLRDFLKGVKREKIIESRERPDLKNIPFPRLDLIKWKLYTKIPLLRGSFKIGYLVPIETSRGCPYDCTYCCVTKYWGRKVRHRPTSAIIEHIKKMPNDAFIVFTDDNIASTPTFAKALFKEMIKEKKNIPKTFFAQFTVNSAKDTELLKLAAEAGCKLAYLGVESIRPESLLSVNKRPNIPDKVYDLIKKGNMTLAKDLLKSYYSEIFSKFRNFGIHPFPSIIVGLKGDSVENINETVDFLIDEGVVFMTQWFYTPAIGSGEFKNFDAEDTVRYKRFGKYDGSRLVLNAEKTVGLIGKDIEKAFWSSYQNFYSPKNTFKRIFKNKTGFCNKINFIVFNLLYYRAVMQRMQPFSLAWRSRWS